MRPGAPLPTTSRPSTERRCIRARAFLPGPDHDARVFYLVDGGLHAQERRGTGVGAVQPLAGLDGKLTITDLLALGNHKDKVELLALVRKNGQETDHLWLIEIRANRIVGAKPAGDLPAFHSKEAFFARFHVPRCKHKDHRCVAAVPTSGKRSLIVEEPRRGQPGRPVSGFDTLAGNDIAGVKDAAWVPGESDELYLAIGCRARAP
ncbi:MAG: hypothetical protein MJE77_36025 [Proteobacteria bacterium]|nr:hypothetical protein [Pseudomonadota bacterium]